MRRKLLLPLSMLLMCLISYAAHAQTKTVTGTVSDDKGTTLPGATVRTPDSRHATQTDVNGKFSLIVPETEKTLVISFVGMANKVVSIAKPGPVNVTLGSSATALTDVVVIGYGTAKRANVTSAISSISENDIKDLPQAGVDQMLQGKVPGVSVASNSGQPGGGVSVRVRGITTISSIGNEPLYVVDGVILYTASSSIGMDMLGGITGQTTQSPLATLNPDDIASIDILKDASAQAIYGSQAANGVVLITTKKGKAGEGRLNYDVYFGQADIYKKLPVMNLQQYAEYYNSVQAEQGAAIGLAPIGEFAKPQLLGAGTSWQDAIFQKGSSENHQLSFSGGNGKTTYYMSGNYFNQTGTVIGSGFDRYAFRASVDQQVKPWLKAGISTNMSYTDQKITLTDGQQSVISLMLYNSPASPVRLPDGSYALSTNIAGVPFGQLINPVALALARDVRARQYKDYGNLYADVFFTKDLDFRTQFNYDFQYNPNTAFQPLIDNSAGLLVVGPSTLLENRASNIYVDLQNYLTYTHTFGGKHYVNLLLGHEAWTSNYDYTQVEALQLTQNLESITAGTVNPAETQGAKYTNASESYFARANYTFDNRYSVSGSVRRDGSSNFGPDKRIGYFEAGSVGWTISNEKFAQNWKPINFLKLRLGAGSVGNFNSGGNQLYTTSIRLATNSAGLFGNTNVPGIPANVGNPALSWESVITYNAGVDATLINHALDVTVDVYKKVSSKMILPTVLPSFAGLDPNPPANAYDEIEPPTTNAGQMTNTGIDIGITSHNITTKDFTWKTSFEYSMYKNVLNRLTNPGAALFGKSQDFSPVTLTESTAGQPVGQFYGFVTNGLYRTAADLANGPTPFLPVGVTGTWLGDIRYKDLDGDKALTNADQTFIGNPNPKFTYGMTNTVTYKGFDLSVFLNGVYGDKIFNYSRLLDESEYDVYENELTTVMNRYTPTNINGSLPRYNQYSETNLKISSRYIESGSYLRLQNVQIGYNVPVRYLSKIKMTRCRIYVSGQNLLTFTKYSGFDPELGSFNGNVTSMNIDYGHYPNPRTLTIGANIEF